MYKYNKGIKKIKYHEMVPEYLSKMLHNKKDNPIYGTMNSHSRNSFGISHIHISLLWLNPLQ